MESPGGANSVIAYGKGDSGYARILT